MRITLVTALLATGCIEGLTIPDESAASPLSPGESRTVTLHYMRLDVNGAEQSLTIEQLRSLPESTLADVWLFDLDLQPLVANALDELRSATPQQLAAMPQAAQNMQRLLNMSPDNADLEGTALAGLVGLSGAVGIPPARALAEILDIGITDAMLSLDAASSAILDGVVATHPNAQVREGPIDTAHPDGLYPVPPGSIPVTLLDVANNFADLESHFGPWPLTVGEHPGFVQRARGVLVIEEDFSMNVRITGNALPYKGVDLTSAALASVNSIPGQIDTLFAFDDPEWLTLDGLVPEPSITELTFLLLENGAFIPGGSTRDPLPLGSSPVWDLPPWELEPLSANMSRFDTAQISAHCTSYDMGTGAQAFEACIDGTGWLAIDTFNDVGDPPPPAYLWDIVLELVQVRMHDGGLAEGEAHVQFSLENVRLGVPPSEIVSEARTNLEQNPTALGDVARLITESGHGDADFYYVRANDHDYLFFLTPEDSRFGADRQPARAYHYDAPGFFADPALTNKLSSAEHVDGDSAHEKIVVSPGDILYTGDDADRRYRVRVLDKPSPHRVALVIERIE